jgi:hypothetical protein
MSWRPTAWACSRRAFKCSRPPGHCGTRETRPHHRWLVAGGSSTDPADLAPCRSVLRASRAACAHWAICIGGLRAGAARVRPGARAESRSAMATVPTLASGRCGVV